MVSHKLEHDESIRRSILQALSEDERTASLGLRVGVLGGIVHLGGEAPSAVLRVLAEELTVRVAGVRGVANRILAPGAPAPARTIHVQLEVHRESRR